MASLTFDDTMRKLMSNYLVAVNRLRHAQERVASLDDPTMLRQLMADEERAEAECTQALVQRGWQAPYAVLRRGA